MIAKRLPLALLGGLVVLALFGRAARAEDLSIHLDRMAEIDADRAAPEFSLHRVPARNLWPGADNLPLATFDVHIRFKDFGDVYLDKCTEEGPSTGADYPKGATVCAGLASLGDVRSGWIKGAPGLFVVGWINEHGGGSNPSPDHVLAILQLKDGRAQLLARLCHASAIRTIEYESGWPLASSRFSWDARAGRLVERIAVDRVVQGVEPGPLRRPAVLDQAGKKGFSAHVEETVTITHAIADGKLVPEAASLVYKARDGDDLADVAAFYLPAELKAEEEGGKPPNARGLMVWRLLVVNTDLAKRFNGVRIGEPMPLAEGDEVRIPADDKELIARHAHGWLVAPPDPLPPSGTGPAAPDSPEPPAGPAAP